jgi:hypothetical protein
MKRSALLLLACAATIIPADASIFLGVTTTNRLVTFDTTASDGVTNDPGAVLVNLSWNSDTNTHYGVDTNANFYSITVGGAATIIDNTFAPSGFAAGFAYDVFTQKFLFASDAAENVLIATNGTRTNNPALAYAIADPNHLTSPVVFGAGIDPDFGTGYFVDSALDILASSIDPDFSELNTVGALGLNAVSFGGLLVDFDGTLWGALSTDGLTSSLYSISTLTGAATLSGGFGAGVGIHTLSQVPEPSRAMLLGLALGGLVLRRRRSLR